MTKKEILVDEMKMLCGIPPHDVPYNICLNDGYFGSSLRSKINNSQWDWNEIHKLAVEEGRKVKPNWDK